MIGFVSLSLPFFESPFLLVIDNTDDSLELYAEGKPPARNSTSDIISGLKGGGAERVLFRIVNSDDKYRHEVVSLTDKGIYFDLETPYGYGGPITNTNDKSFIKEAEKCLNEELIKLNVIAELIKFHPLIKNHLILKDIYRGKIIKVCKTISLNVQKYSENFLLNRIYSYSNRKSIKKAYRNECKIVISNDNYSWSKFIKLYESNLINRTDNKKYFFSKKYYQMIKNYFYDQYLIFSCKIKNEIVSSLLILYTNQFAHCHLIGSNELARKLSANNMLHHEVIKWCKLNNINILHFGGGITNDEKDSVYKFKKSFSNETNDFYIGERVINRNKYYELCKMMTNNNLLNNEGLLKYRDE